jgi:tRNA(Ile)-lysidine synthetase-like protein
MVLLHVLHVLARKHRWRLTVAHLNHQLRGRSSAADERLVRRTAQTLRLPVVVEQADVRRLARTERLSLEMAARELRHDFLARAARRRRIPSIALAHHSDDQIELFFLRLLRGSGGEGLAGMKWRSPSPGDPELDLVRPLLDQPKAVLIEYASAHGLRYREDASNEALDFQRNRIRHELLPLLRRKYQPALHRTIARVMEIVGAEAEFAAEAAREWLREGGSLKSRVQIPKSKEARASLGKLTEGRGGERIPRRGSCFEPLNHPLSRFRHPLPLRGGEGKGEGAVHFPFRFMGKGRSVFEELPVAVQRRCVQVQLVRLGVVPDYELVEQLRLTADRSVAVGHSRTGVSPVLHFAVRDPFGLVRLQEAETEEFKTGGAVMELEGKAGQVEFDGVGIWWRISRQGVVQPPKAGTGRECFDADKVGSLARLRHWQPGDRFQPIGMASTVKLQDFFTNHKVPRDRRRQLVVAATANGEVFWVEGMRISERFKLTKETIRCLQWRWKRA